MAPSVRHDETELHRVWGQILLAQTDNPRGAMEHFEHAIAVARRQDAKLYELRATLKLAQLWSEQGQRLEALDLLTSIYKWFTERCGTRDLREAKALLDELRTITRLRSSAD